MSENRFFSDTGVSAWTPAFPQSPKIYIEAGLPLILSHVCDGAYAHAMTSEEEMTDFTDYLSRMFDDAANMDW